MEKVLPIMLLAGADKNVSDEFYNILRDRDKSRSDPLNFMCPGFSFGKHR